MTKQIHPSRHLKVEIFKKTNNCYVYIKINIKPN